MRFTKEEKAFIKYLLNKSQIHTEISKKLIELHNKVFNTKIECYTCSKVVKSCLDKLIDKYNNETKVGRPKPL